LKPFNVHLFETLQGRIQVHLFETLQGVPVALANNAASRSLVGRDRMRTFGTVCLDAIALETRPGRASCAYPQHLRVGRFEGLNLKPKVLRHQPQRKRTCGGAIRCSTFRRSPSFPHGTGSGFRVQGLGFRVWGLGFRVKG